MRTELCFCADIPQLTLTSKVIIIISKRELKVPTNTGRLASLALPNSVLLAHGDQEKPFDVAEHLMEGRPNFLLYPGDDAQILTSAMMENIGKINLVVPDGNWRQTSKMRRRVPMLDSMPTVRLAPGRPTAYRVRKENKAEGLATIEAIARALAVIESPEVGAELEQLLALMVERTLKSRGALVAGPQNAN